MKPEEILKELQKPFKAEEIEFRGQSQGFKADGSAWIMVLAYVQARAIQNRLDEIFGFDGWQDEYRAEGNNILCRLSVKVNDTWIHKENGASETQVEAFKGGISSAFKRVASSGYGIGRYLYNLETTYAETMLKKPFKSEGWNRVYDKNTKKEFWWKTPTLPDWALPEEERGKQKIQPKTATKDESEAIYNSMNNQGQPDNLCSKAQLDELKVKLGTLPFNKLMFEYQKEIPVEVYKQKMNEVA